MQRQHQTRHQALAQRVLRHAALELGHQLAVASEGEIGLDTELERRQPDLFEPCDRPLREVRVRQVGERRASPQRERVV